MMSKKEEMARIWRRAQAAGEKSLKSLSRVIEDVGEQTTHLFLSLIFSPISFLIQIFFSILFHIILRFSSCLISYFPLYHCV